jgi:coenzyme F420 hydrogenase subunit beta
MNSEIDKVIETGRCVGCGGCAFLAGGRMELDKFGYFRPVLPLNKQSAELANACPFLAPELNEDVLADRFLPDTPNRDHKLGKYFDVLAAHVEEDDFRETGSSGGMGSWIASELLNSGRIDGVIHARPVARTASEAPFFRYGISRRVEEIRRAAHSHYHVVEFSEVLVEVKRTPGRYLFIGVPCMVKAIRRAQVADSDIADRITYTLALVCGHLKSVHWALSLGWSAGIKPEDVGAITFRIKSEDVPAKAYYFQVENRASGEGLVRNAATIVGGKFNLGAMMPEACNYCDDVVGETADVTIGDAWLPRYAFDWRGKNMVITRNNELGALIRSAKMDGRIRVEAMTAKEAVDAQSGGFRQRREGLAYRLAKDLAAGKWAPQKRSLADMERPGLLRSRIYDLRALVATRSRDAFRKALDSGDFSIYEAEMAGTMRRLRWLELFASAPRAISVRFRAMFAKSVL